jgi:hypothetical protein
LADEGVATQIALYLLNGTSATEFLKGLEVVEASYTAEAIDQDGIPFTLEGGLVFQVAEPTDDEIDAAKAAFLAYLEDRVKDIDVADVVIDIDEDGENITVTFDRDAKPTDVLQTANELVAALKGELYSATLILNNDETNGGFDLADEGVAAQIALYLLNGTSPAEFLKGLETIEASYTAEAIDQDGIPFTLAGELVFQMAELPSYVVIFVDWDGSVIDTQTVEYGGSATAPEVSEREGYTFTGWDKAFDNVTGDLTVTAQYEAIDYALIVKYEYSDGSEAAATYTATLNMGDEYNVASPEITGHTPDQVTVSGTMPAKDVTVTVVYTVNQYTITFNSAGGSAIVPITLDYGAVVIAPEDPTREGYTFAGWEPELPATMPAQDIEVTAQWTINKYTVTFVDWDGSVIDTQTVEHGGSATAPEVSEREGYTFNGWDKAFDNVTGDLTVTAQYAMAEEGFTFVGWANAENKMISYDSTYTFELLRDVTITPLFYQANEAEVARIGATGYETLEAALSEAVSGDIVILSQDYTLAGNATVPGGVLLLLPCGSEDYTGYTETGFNPDGTSTSKEDLSVLYKTLTIPENVTMTVEGTIMVNAVTGRPAAGHYDQDITGGYSQIMLEGKIIVKEGGLLDVFGKVKGPGMIEALDGGSVGDLYVVKHWRGGTQALFSYLMGIYPFNEYELHNIETNLKINSGASYYGNVKMYADSSYHYTRFYQFDQAKGLIKMAPGAFALKTYDSGSGQTTVVINGGAEEIGGSMIISGVPATTRDYFFPVDGHITFVLENGEYAVNNMIKFLPGSVLTIGEEAILTVKTDAQLIMYEEFIDDGGNLRGTEYPLRDPAQFNLDGTLVIEGAFGGLIDAGISAQIVVSNDANLEVSSREAKRHQKLENEVYTVTTNLGIDFASDVAWYYYPNGENSDVAIPVLDSYEGIDYINLNLNPASYRGHTFIVDEYTSINYTLTYTAGANGSILGDVTQTVKHGSDGTAVEAVADEGYHFEKWSDGSTDNPRTDTNVTADISVAAEFAINTYTVTFLDHDGNELKTETVEHGGSATAPTAPAREGYTFTGWDEDFSNVTSDLTVTALYSYDELTGPGKMSAEDTKFEEESKETGTEPDTVPIDVAIQAAENAKSDVVVSEDGTDVPAGNYWVNQADMDALDAAIAKAETARETAEIQEDVDDTAAELEAAIAAFNNAKQEAIDEEEIEESGQGEEPAEGEKPEEDVEPVEGEELEELEE